MVGLIIAVCNGALVYFSTTQLTDKKFIPAISSFAVFMLTMAAYYVGRIKE